MAPGALLELHVDFFFYLFFLPCISMGSGRPRRVSLISTDAKERQQNFSTSDECVLLNAELCFTLQMLSCK